MPVITKLEPQKRDPERVNVHLDGAFAFGAALSVVIARGLAEGSDLLQSEIESLRGDDEAEKAYSSALRFLAPRPRSHRELHDYLRRKGIDEVVAHAVMERLVNNNLVNDAEFANFWVDNRQAFKPRGRRALHAELRQKGVDREAIDIALERVGDEDEAAYEAGHKRLRGFSSLAEDDFSRKMLAFLQRRGFAYAVSARATKRLLETRKTL